MCVWGGVCALASMSPCFPKVSATWLWITRGQQLRRGRGAGGPALGIPIPKPCQSGILVGFMLAFLEPVLGHWTWNSHLLPEGHLGSNFSKTHGEPPCLAEAPSRAPVGGAWAKQKMAGHMRIPPLSPAPSRVCTPLALMQVCCSQTTFLTEGLQHFHRLPENIETFPHR